MRRIYQVELVVKKSPKMPDFEGLEALVDSAAEAAGAVVVPTMQSWLSAQQRDATFVMKQRRLWTEELAASNKRKPDSGGAGGK